jgi:hypothetical protein
VRINHNITQWQERQFDGCLHDFASTAAIRPETDGSKLETKMGADLEKNKRIKKPLKRSQPSAAPTKEKGPEGPFFIPAA